MTVKVTIGALIVALLGLAVAPMRISPCTLRYAALLYTDLLRGTPALVQLFIIYFGLSDLGLEFDPVTAAIVGLGINGAAYVGEIYRAGIEAIHRGQLEAALSLGMTPLKAMRFIVLPQAIRIMLPPSATTPFSWSRTPRSSRPSPPWRSCSRRGAWCRRRSCTASAARSICCARCSIWR